MQTYFISLVDRKAGHEMNGAKWLTLLAPYLEKIQYNPNQVGGRRFGITCDPETAEQIRQEHTELNVEEAVSYTSGPAPIDFRTIKDSHQQ